METCLCDNTLQNLGRRACELNFSELFGLIFVPTYDNAGAKNKIAAADTLNLAYFQGLINNADVSKRWYPVWEIDNVENVRAEGEKFTTESNRNIYVQQGVRSFSAKLFKASNKMVGKLNAVRCNDVSVYLVDAEGNLIGSYDGTDLYPIKLDTETFEALFTFAKTAVPQDVMITFQFDRREKDEDLMAITATEMGCTISDIPALLDVVTANVTPIDTTSFSVELSLANDTLKTAIPLQGWVAADFEVGGVAALSLVESPTGTYTITTADYTGLTKEVTQAATKLGYEMAAFNVTYP